MTTTPSKPSLKPAAKDARADALRANLTRRKAQAKRQGDVASEPQDGCTTQEGGLQSATASPDA